MDDWVTDEQLAISPVVRLPGYRFRTVIPFNDALFDPMLGNWIEPDGSVPICDVGGQPRNAVFDPEHGHGAIWWLRPDDRLEPAVPWGHTQLGMPMFPRLAPPSFGRWAGHALVIAQVHPGREGAHWDHVVHKWDRRADQFELFAILPRNDSAIGEGIPSALIPGDFGPAGSPLEGSYFCTALRNNTVYRVRGNGRAETFAKLDGVSGPVVLPRALCFGDDDHFPDFPQHRGKLIVGGVPNTNFTATGDSNKGRATGQECVFHVIENDGTVAREPFCRGNRMLAFPARAGVAFGPLSGQLIYTDHGTINQSQSIFDHGPLPHDGRLLYRDAEGVFQPLVTGLRSGRNDIIFTGSRLIITHFGKSYSTGEYHQPDGSIWELTYEGG